MGSTAAGRTGSTDTSIGTRGASAGPPGHPRRRSRLRLLPPLLAVLLLLLAAAPVLAHAELVSSDPADGAEVATPPTTVTLTFSEGLDAKKSSFRLSDSGGLVGTGKAAKDGATVMTLTGLALEPGQYVVKWTSAAEDGHLDRGTLSFTVLAPTPTPAPTPIATPAATATPSASPTAAPTAAWSPSDEPATDAPASSASAAAPSPAPGDASNAGSTGGDVVLPIAAGLVLVAVVGAYVLRRSRAA